MYGQTVCSMSRPYSRRKRKIADLQNLIILGLLSFLVNLGYGIVLPVLPTLAAATAFDVGMMYTAFSATKLVAQLYGGASADRFGAHVLMRIGVGIYAVSLAGLAFSHTVLFVLAFRVLEGVAVGICVPAVSALVLGTGDEASFTRRHGVVLGIGGAGMVMGPLVGLLVGRDSVRAAMIAIAIVTALAALCAPRIERAEVAIDDDAFSAQALLRYAASPAFMLLVLPLAFGKLAFGVLQPLIPLHAARTGMSDTMVAMLFVMTGVLFAVTQPVVGLLRARMNARDIALGCAVLAALSLGAIAGYSGPVGFSTCYLVYVVFGSMLFAANSGLVGETHHEAERDHGKVFGAMHTVTDAGMLVVPPLLLALYERDLRACFVTVGALGLGAALVFAVGTRDVGARRAAPDDAV